jgi:hypothetical protein
MALSIAGDMGEYDDIQIGRKWLSVLDLTFAAKLHVNFLFSYLLSLWGECRDPLTPQSLEIKLSGSQYGAVDRRRYGRIR